MSDNDQLIEQFKNISGVDNERAKFFLESSGWNIETALSSFYEENEESDPIDVDETPAPAATAPVPTVRGEDMPRVGMDLSESSSGEEEEGQAFYAGGSLHSGQQVLGPARKKKKNVVSSLFKSAKKHGAEVVEDKEKGGSKTKKINFKGTGYRLGETENDHEVVAKPDKKDDKPRDVVLGMWKEGFTVDNGPLRRYDDPNNMDFLNSVRRGQIPLELIREAKGGEVYINMEDHRHEDYVAPKQNLKAFSGAGHSLGSVCPSVVGQVTNASTSGSSGSPVSSQDVCALEAKASADLNVDSTQPTTNIQFRLPDGTRLVLKANHGHTVGDLRSYLTTARPSVSRPFAIMMTFPHKELADDSKTVTEANIINAALVIKPK